eukprot:COSAG04_NODE_1390_length_6957_cov_4.929425_3_plen_125_part_00
MARSLPVNSCPPPPPPPVVDLIRRLSGFLCAGVDGQTGSGKTYTMQGEVDSVGITPRAVNLLFELMEPEFDFTFEVRSTDTFRRLPMCLRSPQADGCLCWWCVWPLQVQVSYLQVYREQVSATH